MLITQYAGTKLAFVYSHMSGDDRGGHEGGLPQPSTDDEVERGRSRKQRASQVRGHVLSGWSQPKMMTAALLHSRRGQ